jgi:hypothetical protein
MKGSGPNWGRCPPRASRVRRHKGSKWHEILPKCCRRGSPNSNQFGGTIRDIILMIRALD